MVRISLNCKNPDNEFGFFRSWSDVCRSCKGISACRHSVAAAFIVDCKFSFDPDRLICQECRHKKLCRFQHKGALTRGSF